MQKTISYVIGICISLYTGHPSASAQAPVFNAVTPNKTTINRFQKFELSIQVTAKYNNPFNYNDIAVQCIFNAPNGRQDTVDAFYYQDFILDSVNGKLSENGPAMFKVRFTPRQKGIWKYRLTCTTQAGKNSTEEKTFTCLQADDKGFIRTNETNYLSFDDGSQFIPIGENMNVPETNLYKDFHKWIDKLAANGANFIRPWLINYGFGLEWKNGVGAYKGFMKYNEQNSFWLDWLMEYCGRKGVYIMLCLNNGGDFTKKDYPFWDLTNCTHLSNGECNYAWEFYTNAKAREFLKNRLRYIIARWGYSKNIACWELISEPDGDVDANKFSADITDWIKDMAYYVRRKDVYNHLITASYSYFENGAATWALRNIDFTQTHSYFTQPNLERIISAIDDRYIEKYGKPTLCGEFGIYTANEPLYSIDPQGVHIHNAIWASTFGGASGTALTYWWHVYIDRQNLYYHFKPLSSFVEKLKLKDDNYKKANAYITGGNADTVILKPTGGWKLPTETNFVIDASGKSFLQQSHLGVYLYGKEINTEFMNPPVFHVNYPQDGQFSVVTGSTKTNAPEITIYLDGKKIFSKPAQVNSNYAVNIPAGAHTIRVDNTGKDWMWIDNYIFIRAVSQLNSYVLHSASKTKAAGYVLNADYNWQYLQHHNGVLPARQEGATLVIPGMQNGTYTIKFFSCSSAEKLSEITTSTSSNALAIPLPSLQWDIAFTAIKKD